MGILFGVNALGLAIGPVLGGLIVGALSWRWVFFVNIPLIVLSFIICIPNVEESYNKEDKNKIDYLGSLILISGLSSLVLAFTKANEWGWSTPITLVLFGVTILMLILFYVVENKIAEPIIKFDLFINRKFITSIIATFSMAFFYCIAFFLMPLYLHDIRGDNNYLVGFMMLPTTATIALLSPFVGRYVDRHGPKGVLLLGFIFLCISALLQTQFNTGTSLFKVILAFISLGIGWSYILGPSTVLSLSSLPESSGGLAMGASWTLHNIGGVIGLGIGLTIYHIQMINHANSFIAGYQGAMLLLVATSLLTFITLYWEFMKKTGSF